MLPRYVDAARGASDRLRTMAGELEAWREAGYTWRDRTGDGRVDFAGRTIWRETTIRLQELLFGEYRSELDTDLVYGGTYRTLVHVFDGTAAFDWIGEAGFDSERAVLREAMGRAAVELQARFDSPDPADWTAEADTSSYLGISAAGGETIPPAGARLLEPPRRIPRGAPRGRRRGGVAAVELRAPGRRRVRDLPGDRRAARQTHRPARLLRRLRVQAPEIGRAHV